MQRRSQRVVLVLFGRLIEQIVEHDGARMLRIERSQKLGEKSAVERRAIREVLHRGLVDRDDDDIGILRLERRSRGDFPVLDEAVGARQERNVVDREHGQHADDDRDRWRRLRR